MITATREAPDRWSATHGGGTVAGCWSAPMTSCLLLLTGTADAPLLDAAVPAAGRDLETEADEADGDRRRPTATGSPP